MCVLCCFQITFNSTSKATSRSSLAGKGSLDSAVSHGHQMFTKVVTYEGQSLAVKVVHKQYIAVTKDVIKEINEVHIPTKVSWSEFETCPWNTSIKKEATRVKLSKLNNFITVLVIPNIQFYFLVLLHFLFAPNWFYNSGKPVSVILHVIRLIHIAKYPFTAVHK